MSRTCLDMFPVLRMRKHGNFVVIQPWWQGSVADKSLTCDLETGTICSDDHPPIETGFTRIFGVLGVVNFDSGPALIVISAVEEVAELRGHPLLRVTGTQTLHCAGNGKWTNSDASQLALLRSGTDPKKFGGSLYYAAGGDPTLTQQEYESVVRSPGYANSTSWTRANLDICWNYILAKPLVDANLHDFVPPVFMGFVAQISDLDFSGSFSSKARITLIARRSARRAGTRQWRRGIDLDGYVANFVETEQLIEFPESKTCASFVQVRGSVPIFWSQTPNLKYKIPIHIAPQSKNNDIIVTHFKKLAERYGKVTAINLANQTGREGRLSSSYYDAANVAAEKVPNCRLVPFDFHKHCGATRYDRLALLWKDLERDFEDFKYNLIVDGTENQSQTGVFRTNCIDTLDRTNVVQGLLARHALEAVLKQQGLLREGETFAETFPTIEPVFRIIWADHGDEISCQYAGTGAMKSAFTRTGKRDLAGLLDDGRKSLTRYFLNNFRDGEKQDAIDLVTTGVISNSKFRRLQQASPLLPTLFALFCIVTGAQKATTHAVLVFSTLLASPFSFSSIIAVVSLYDLMTSILLLGLGFMTLRMIFAFGETLVDRPSLRPNMAKPWKA